MMAIEQADLAAAAAVVEVRARTAPALTALAQRLRDAVHDVSDVTDAHCTNVAALSTTEETE